VWEDTIVLCGIATDFGVESTARFAYEFGFQQVFAEDAMSSISAEQHNAAVNFIFKRMGRVRKTDEIIKATVTSPVPIASSTRKIILLLSTGYDNMLSAGIRDSNIQERILLG